MMTTRSLVVKMLEYDLSSDGGGGGGGGDGGGGGGGGVLQPRLVSRRGRQRNFLSRGGGGDGDGDGDGRRNFRVSSVSIHPNFHPTR